MRELHVVATSSDGRRVLLARQADSRTGEFAVVIDERLSAAVHDVSTAVPRPGTPTRPKPHLTPAQIQARLRAGESAEQIAASAGVPIGRVERFAGPVEGERRRMIDEVRGAFVTRPRLGTSLLPLGASVKHRLERAQRYDPAQTVWSARREAAGTWVVQVSYRRGSRSSRAAWRYDPHQSVSSDPRQRRVIPLDAPSNLLAHVCERVMNEYSAPRRQPVRAATSGLRAPRSAVPTRDAGGSRVRASVQVAVRAHAPAPSPPPARSAAAVSAAAPRPVRRAPTARPTSTVLPRPTVGAPTGSGRPRLTVVGPPARPAAPAERPTRRRRASAAGRQLVQGALELDLAPAVRRGAGGRAAVPAWDDVLFGTARPPRGSVSKAAGD